MTSSPPKALLRSLIFSYVLSGILILALSFALYKLKMKEAQINVAVYVVYILACMAGGLMAGKVMRLKRFFWGLLSGLLYFVVLLAVSWILKQGLPLDTSRMLTVMGCCALGGTIGGMIS